jgi:DNA-directed RNA polymerase specialized sigma24 family protein
VSINARLILNQTYSTRYAELIKFASNVHSKQDSTDLVADSYLHIMNISDERLNNYLAKRKPYNFIISCIYNLAKDLRHKNSKVILKEDFSDLVQEEDNKHDLELINKLVSELPPDEHLTITSLAIGKYEAISTGMCRMTIHRTKKRIQKKIKNKYYENR